MNPARAPACPPPTKNALVRSSVKYDSSASSATSRNHRIFQLFLNPPAATDTCRGRWCQRGSQCGQRARRVLQHWRVRGTRASGSELCARTVVPTYFFEVAVLCRRLHLEHLGSLHGIEARRLLAAVCAHHGAPEVPRMRSRHEAGRQLRQCLAIGPVSCVQLYAHAACVQLYCANRSPGDTPRTAATAVVTHALNMWSRKVV